MHSIGAAPAMSRSTLLVLVATLTTSLVPVRPGLRAQEAEPSRDAPTRLADHPRVVEALHLVETWLDAQRAYEEIPGISAAVVSDQSLVWSGAAGHAHPEREAPATAGTVYSICSISKLFTSVSVMRLRDEGLLELDDPVSEHLPWFDLEQAHPDSPPITVERILTHSAGLPREAASPYWSPPNFDFPTREEVIERLSGQETLYPSAKYFQYSNLGLTLAGEIVRELSGQAYDAYVREHILRPLGMESTWPEIPTELHGGRMATGYSAMTREGVREPVPVFRARGIAPAAGFASTVGDLAKFAMWQFRLDPGEMEILAGNTLREMHRVHWVDPDWETHWGLGFSVWRSDDETFVGHGGSCPGYRSQLLLQPEEKVAAVVMANALGVSPRMYAQRIYGIVKPALDEAREGAEGRGMASDETPAAGETSDDEAPPLSDYTGTYDVGPWGGEIEALVWKGSLRLLYLPTDDPLEALTELERVEGDTFRRVRDDGELGERIVFERDDAGDVVRMIRFNNYDRKIR